MKRMLLDSCRNLHTLLLLSCQESMCCQLRLLFLRVYLLDKILVLLGI